MQSIPLDLYTNQKYNIYKKNYNQCDQYLKNCFHGKTQFSQSWQKLNKYLYTYPQNSQIYRSTIRKIIQIGKRLQDKYNGKKSFQSLFHYIDQNTHQLQQNDINTQKEEQPPLKIIAPEGSRVLANDDSSAIVFPPPIVQVRPLSTPKPELYVPQPGPIISQTFVQPTAYPPIPHISSPTKVLYHEPIIRRVVNHGNQIISVPIPPGQQMILKPRPVNLPPNTQTYVQPYPPMPMQQTKIIYTQNPPPMLTRSISQNLPRPQSTMSSNSYDNISISANSTGKNFFTKQTNIEPSEQLQQYPNFTRNQSSNKQNIVQIDKNNPHNPLINLKRQQNMLKKQNELQNNLERIKLNSKINNLQFNQFIQFQNGNQFNKELQDLEKLRNLKKQKQLIKKMDNVINKYGQLPIQLPPQKQLPISPTKCQPQEPPMIESIVNKFSMPSIFKNEKQREVESRIWPDNFYEIPKITEIQQNKDSNENKNEDEGQFMRFTKNVINQFKQIFNL